MCSRVLCELGMGDKGGKSDDRLTSLPLAANAKRLARGVRKTVHKNIMTFGGRKQLK